MTRPVLLLAHGLDAELTGIERVVVSYATWWVGRGTPVVVTVDDNARWPGHLPAAVRQVRVPRRRAQLWRSAGTPSDRAPLLVHSFGPRFSHTRAPLVYTVYDWGPFRDRGMPPAARVAWVGAVVSGVSSADVVHVISDEVASRRPRWLGRRAQWRVVPPDGLPVAGVVEDRDGSVLFVGTDVPRKRIEALVAAVALDPTLHLVLAGAGTAAHDDGDRVHGLGPVADAELERLYARCSLVALVSSYEGYGIPVREALDRGLPVVVSPAVARCHPDADPSRVVVSPEPQQPQVLSSAIRRALDLGVTTPPPATSAPSPADLYAGLV